MRQPDDLITEIKSLQNDLTELKTPQSFAGDSWKMYSNVIDDSPFDATFTTTSSNKIRMKIIFTPENPEELCAAKLIAFYNVTQDGGFWAPSPVNGTDSQWWFLIQTDTNITIALKFIIWSTQSGTISYEVM